MRILVSVLYCIENELEECKAAINRQTHPEFELFTIEKLPKKLAHDTLYKEVMRRSDDFDLFIKMDADMVLKSDSIFADIAAEVEKHPDIDHFQIGVWDHFTNHLIHALNIYRTNVKWDVTSEQLFTDRSNRAIPVREYLDMNHKLVPAADHCPNPSQFQSFHFGVHKAAKIIQKGGPVKIGWAQSQADKLYSLYQNYRQHTDQWSLQYALLGAFWAFDEKIGAAEVDFSSEVTHQAFDDIVKQSDAEFQNLLNKQLVKYRMNLSRRAWNTYLINRITLGRSGPIARGLSRITAMEQIWKRMANRIRT